ncbi:hypothetical protein P3X46_020339 [Hevea brasiliensis]|uniref:CASP-like protein n=1 Tax=Hevea brasiliensis TaxID=3981 RepID=A0ABQ9LLL1_HEVBR|nr:CASP-like protein 1C2 [Hevea brasiliensis]KAJ9168856.1 hypothetical protein P3X46_020339 [Hevea brasiliensis]
MAVEIKKFFFIVLRLLALAATVVAIVVMVRSHDSAQVLNLTFTAKYNNTPAFKYFVIAEAIASVYTIIVIFLSSKSLLGGLIVILDMVITVLLSSSISAALAIAQVGKKGNSHAGWLPICGQVPKFCDQVTIALIAGFVAPVIYFVLLLCSLHAVLSPILAAKL